MLKGIPKIISPKLIKTLMEMGHGDTLAILGGNFPSAKCSDIILRADGHGIKEIINAILPFFPLDNNIEPAVAIMSNSKEDLTKIENEFSQIIYQYEKKVEYEFLEKKEFYNKVINTYAVVVTSDTSFRPVVLRKGVVI